MIVALLVLIVLILLFGAGVVQGWLANILGLGCGGLVLLVGVLWLGPSLGENGVTFIFWSVCGLLGVMAVGLAAGQGANFAPAELSAPCEPPPTDPPSARRLPPPPRRPKPVERVWQWFADDIHHTFTPEAQAMARTLYDAGDPLGLDRFCREEVGRVAKPGAEEPHGPSSEGSYAPFSATQA